MEGRLPAGIRGAPGRPAPDRRWPRLPLAVSLLALLLASLLAAWPLPARAEDPAETARRLLADAPGRPPAARAAWILERARLLPDGRVALALLAEMPARAPEAQQAQARLWRVRYWMAADSLDRAAGELRLLGEPRGDEPWADEARYWGDLIGVRGDGRARGREPARSPSAWELRGRLAALVGETGPAPGVREALALEGEARRAGLLGPWIWQLAHSGESALRRAALAAARSALFELAHAPEAAEWIGEAAARRARSDEQAQEGASGAAPAPAGVDTLAAGIVTEGVLPEPAGGHGSAGDRETAAGRAPASERDAAVGRAPSARFAAEVRLLDDEGAARALAAEIARKGFAAGVAPLAPGGPFRVYLGPCRESAEAESLGAALERRLLLPYRIVEVP